jgi:hypothetical protein
MDCAGLIWAAYAGAGRVLVRPRAYPLRGWCEERITAALVLAGFLPCAGAVRDGDVALMALPAGQFHLGLLASDRAIHAHAGLRRVVETPIDDGWWAADRWRLLK